MRLLVVAAVEPTPSAMCARVGAELGPLSGVIDSIGHDPMACLRIPYLTGEQNTEWSDTFNAWFL